MAMSLNEAIIQAKKAPCASKITKMIMDEVQGGNKVKAFDRIASLPNETYYILLFADSPKADYADAKTLYKENGDEYKVIALSDNHGCTEIRFNY